MCPFRFIGSWIIDILNFRATHCESISIAYMDFLVMILLLRLDAMIYVIWFLHLTYMINDIEVFPVTGERGH